MVALLNRSALAVEIRVSIVVLNCDIMKQNGQRCIAEKEALNGRKLVINPDAMPEEEHARHYNRPMGLHEVCVLMTDGLLPRELEIRLRAPLPGERQTVVVPECSRAHDCLRSRFAIALAVKSSGIAATLLTGGRTFHSRFRAPLKPDNTCPFLIAKQIDLAELIRRADLIVWDEAPMSNKFHLEALDITLRDLCNNDESFGEKVLLLAVDFRQVLPVVKHGLRAQQIDASMKMSPLWKLFEIHQLTENMRILSLADDEMARRYDHFLMCIGNGDHPHVVPNEPDGVRLPREICTDKLIDELISWTFDDVSNHVGDAEYFLPRLILFPTNDDAGSVNNRVLDDFPGENTLDDAEKMTVEGDADNCRVDGDGSRRGQSGRPINLTFRDLEDDNVTDDSKGDLVESTLVRKRSRRAKTNVLDSPRVSEPTLNNNRVERQPVAHETGTQILKAINQLPDEALASLEFCAPLAERARVRDSCSQSQRSGRERDVCSTSQQQNRAGVIVVSDDKHGPAIHAPNPRAYLGKWFEDAKKVGIQNVLTELLFEMFVKSATVVKDGRIWKNFLEWKRNKLTNMRLQRKSLEALPSNPLNVSDLEASSMLN
ncbi:hypothetical protein CBR_g37595 [Chara braunii]|uniref:ATP-dependent DNA helicase n=1 Tax=Chara braunii TaxID=69332 RepID=A0A388LNI4_CHABU|nr:hypothetical protein CBR_g37595 [Chara braunii]|eukprot:GBG83795.1 hypothetical protein CBR_g37595 [Chara braunii]